MKIDGLIKQFNELKDDVDYLQAQSFDTYRDADENLHVRFGNGRDIQLPVIPLRTYQKEVRHKIFIEGLKRVFLVMSRRAGKEVQSWEFLIEAAITDPGTYLMVYPTIADGRQILWDGNITLPDGSILKFLDMIPSELVHKIDNSELKVKLKNGSTIYIIGSDVNIDKLRGRNPKACVFSEYAFSDPRVFLTILPAILNNKGWVLIQTTFNGMNHAYQKMQEVKGDSSWYCRIDSCLTLVDEQGKRYIGEDVIEEARKAGMPEWLILQEFFCEVVFNEELLMFGREMKFATENNLIEDFIINPGKKSWCCWDLGVSDSTVCSIFQLDNFGNPQVVYTFEDSNKSLQHYIKHSEDFANKYNLVILNDFIPHDGKNRRMLTNSVSSIEDSFRELGRNPITIDRVSEKFSAIQLMRNYIRKTKIHKKHASRTVECLSNYRREYDEKLKIFKEKPVHDWASHGVDNFQTMCLAVEGGLCVSMPTEIIYY